MVALGAMVVASGCRRSPPRVGEAMDGSIVGAADDAGVVVASSGAIPPPPDVATPPADAETTASGLVMKVLERGKSADHPGADDCVKMRFTGWRRDGTVALTSRSDPDGQMECLRAMGAGISETLKAMAPGESRRAWVPAALTVSERDHPDKVPTDLTFDIVLVEIEKAPPVPEDLKPSKKAVKTPSGLSFRILKKGTGTAHPALDERVTLQLSGWKADGTPIETTAMSHQPITYVVSDMLPGMREGVQRMVVGDKARLWIPGALAYGTKPMRVGPPTGDLVYDLELVAIE